MAESSANKNGEPEQILNLETSGDIATPELAKVLHIYLLPKREAKKTEETATDEETDTGDSASNRESEKPTEEEDSDSADDKSAEDKMGERQRDH